MRLATQSQEVLRLAVALPRRLEHEIAGLRQVCETLQDHAHLRRDTNDLCHQRLLVTNHRSTYLKDFFFDQSEIDDVKREPMESSGFFIGSTSDPLFPFSFDNSAGARSCVP